MNKDFNGFKSEDAKKHLKNQGINPDNIKKEDAQKLLNSLSKEDAQKINALLNDKAAIEKILNSDKAKNIMQQLFGGK